MADIERRLRAIEKRLALDYEALHNVHGRSNAYRHIFSAICKPICAENPSLLPIIIQNLKNYEGEAQLLNSHAMMIEELRYVRGNYPPLAMSVDL